MSLIIKPEMSEAAEKAKRNAVQLERRKIALAILPQFFASSCDTVSGDIEASLKYADALLEATKIED